MLADLISVGRPTLEIICVHGKVKQCTTNLNDTVIYRRGASFLIPIYYYDFVLATFFSM